MKTLLLAAALALSATSADAGDALQDALRADALARKQQIEKNALQMGSETAVYMKLCTNPEITELSRHGRDTLWSATATVGGERLLEQSNALIAKIEGKRHEFCTAATPKMKERFQHKQPPPLVTTGERPFTFGGANVTVMLPGEGDRRDISTPVLGDRSRTGAN
jgi:hypothetical protein